MKTQINKINVLFVIIIALVIGALGLAVGGAGLLSGRRSA